MHTHDSHYQRAAQEQKLAADLQRQIAQGGLAGTALARIVVPEGMRDAAFASLNPRERQQPFTAYMTFLEAALRWLSENPIVPRDDQVLPSLGYQTSSTDWPKDEAERKRRRAKSYREGLCRCLGEWQRRMFLAPEPEDPSEIRDLLATEGYMVSVGADYYNERIRIAFKRGKESR